MYGSSRKRGGRSESTSSRRTKRGRQEMNTLFVTRALAAATVVVLAATAAAGVAHTMQGPRIRRTVYEPPRRLDWDEHAEDLEQRDCFRRMYRMPRESFDKLADLLAPLLTRNAYFGGELRACDREWGGTIVPVTSDVICWLHVSDVPLGHFQWAVITAGRTGQPLGLQARHTPRCTRRSTSLAPSLNSVHPWADGGIIPLFAVLGSF